MSIKALSVTSESACFGFNQSLKTLFAFSQPSQTKSQNAAKIAFNVSLYVRTMMFIFKCKASIFSHSHVLLHYQEHHSSPLQVSVPQHLHLLLFVTCMVKINFGFKGCRFPNQGPCLTSKSKWVGEPDQVFPTVIFVTLVMKHK